MKYIDVSEHQGIIDWSRVKGNVDGVIIRAGYGKGIIDKQFTRNVENCNALGIPCGAYWFSYGKNPEDAIQEARHLLSAVKAYRMELPLCYDLEYDTVKNAQKHGITLNKETASDMVRAFCNTIEQGGYWALNYANPDFLTRYFDEIIPLRYGLWLAQWKKTPDLKSPPRTCAIWQWGTSSVPGIDGDVDTNESYTDFAKVIKEIGLNNLNFTQSMTQSRKKEAMTWMKNLGVSVDDSMEDIVWLLYEYHRRYGPEDPKADSGMLH